NRLTAQDDDGTVTVTYDAVDRLASQADVFGTRLTFTYDSVGNRTVVQDSAGGYTTSTYDGVNQLTSRQFANGTTPLREDFSYTVRGQLDTASRYSDLA